MNNLAPLPEPDCGLGVHRSTYSPDAMRAYAMTERERCRARVLQIIGWHRGDYNTLQIDTLTAELQRVL